MACPSVYQTWPHPAARPTSPNCQTNALATPRRITPLHAIAHKELNATDLALDMACRFVVQNLPKDFYNDWLGVADDESRHVLMLSDGLTYLGAA